MGKSRSKGAKGGKCGKGKGKPLRKVGKGAKGKGAKGKGKPLRKVGNGAKGKGKPLREVGDIKPKNNNR